MSFGIEELERADHGLAYVFAVDGDDRGDGSTGRERLLELVAYFELRVRLGFNIPQGSYPQGL
jgi:hypothetical protein